MKSILIEPEFSAKAASILGLILLPAVTGLIIVFAKTSFSASLIGAIFCLLLMLGFLYVLIIHRDCIQIEGDVIRVGAINRLTRRFTEKRRLPLSRVKEFLLVKIMYPVSADETRYPFYLYAQKADGGFTPLYQCEGKDAALPLIRRLAAAAERPWRDLTAEKFESEHEFTDRYR